MKKLLLFLAMSLLTVALSAQYTLYKEVNGIQFYTQWSHEKWWSKKSAEVLLVKVINTSDSAASFTLGLEFFKNILLVEESPEATYCIKAHKKLKPRLSGMVFKPVKKRNEFDAFELTGLEIEKVSACPK